MAVQNEEPQGNEKRKIFVQNRPTRKLVLNEQVEVRSLEVGFLGSWHVGMVIGCGEESRMIKYRDILSEEGSGNLVEWVTVSPVVDGLVLENQGTPINHRGNIRPIPPLINFQKWSLHYGQCVDVFVQDAWWEGVVFDHEVGSDERKVFFPDMGDEIKSQTKWMRITRDWDEVTEEWKPRGTWLFLELIVEVEQEWPLLVSVRQIWYELQLEKGFQCIKEWTYSSRDIWKELLVQVLCNNFKLTVKQIFPELNSSGDLRQGDLPFLEFSEPALDAALKYEAFFGDSLAIVPYETECHLKNHAVPLADFNDTGFFPFEGQIFPDSVASMKQYCWSERNDSTRPEPILEEASCLPPALSLLPPNRDNVSSIGSDNNSVECPTVSSKKCFGKLKSVMVRNRLQWLTAGPDMVPEAEYCPSAVTDYIETYGSNDKHRNIVKLNARKHLSYLGWKIDFARDRKISRMRYISPKGQIFFSLLKVCLELEPRSVIVCPNSQDNSDGNNFGPDNNLITSPLPEKPQACRGALKLLSHSELSIIEPDNCPQAVFDYLLFMRSEDFRHSRNAANSMALKAKKHLSASGWALYIHLRKRKKEMRYRSPCGRLFYSLVKACEWCVTEEGLCPSNGYTSDQMQNKHVSSKTMLQLAVKESSPSIDLPDDLSRKLLTESSSGAFVPKELLDRGKFKVHGTRRPKKKRKRGVQCSSALLQTDHQSVLCPLLQNIRESQALIEKGHILDAEYSTPVLQSRKRAPQIVGNSSTHQTPRTILSWLIDGSMVLPRAKVKYCGRKDGHPMKEGRITREGIKCVCCQKIFTLSKFEAHAGSTYHRPSANIFLEDGRSLLECQLQLKHKNNTRKTQSQLREIKGNRNCNANDYICSVCHYGGELVLCDQCPSSFHTTCLGLKEVPDGDWFCPSCCCGICLLGRFNKSTEQLMDDRVLNCGQCEHQYHIGCLRNKGILKLDSNPEGKWFCNKGCEQIYSGLHKLLGKPIPVGLDNLTWTLLKYTKGEDSDHDGQDDENLMEIYSKLKVALSVMHECFEPVKEPRTRRDLVEDVIFNRWSELNRLNFQGFYTVLLERGDELITVATVRVYGEKVAEIPLIGTRFQYRQLGMCRTLMNELEKKLMELGVERLVLPAVPSVLNTWTTSFGFSMMNESERLKFLDYTFLDFQGSVMCQKILKPN